jgi:hypothetical protein
LGFVGGAAAGSRHDDYLVEVGSENENKIAVALVTATVTQMRGGMYRVFPLVADVRVSEEVSLHMIFCQRDQPCHFLCWILVVVSVRSYGVGVQWKRSG